MLESSLLLDVASAVSLGFGMGLGVLVVSTMLKNVYTPFGGISPGRQEFTLSILVGIFLSVFFMIISLVR